MAKNVEKTDAERIEDLNNIVENQQMAIEYLKDREAKALAENARLLKRLGKSKDLIPDEQEG